MMRVIFCFSYTNAIKFWSRLICFINVSVIIERQIVTFIPFKQILQALKYDREHVLLQPVTNDEVPDEQVQAVFILLTVSHDDVSALVGSYDYAEPGDDWLLAWARLFDFVSF